VKFLLQEQQVEEEVEEVVRVMVVQELEVLVLFVINCLYLCHQGRL
jgi:hypothetical protein